MLGNKKISNSSIASDKKKKRQNYKITISAPSLSTIILLLNSSNEHFPMNSNSSVRTQIHSLDSSLRGGAGLNFTRH